MKVNNLLDKYFASKGIETRFNTLGFTEELVSCYISETKNDVVNNISNANKAETYSKYFDFEPRPKYTGFEYLKQQDLALREKLYLAVNVDQTSEQYFSKQYTGSKTYQQLLNESFDFNKPVILYLSGGIDSEFVANELINAAKKFTPLICEWMYAGKQVNYFDTEFALKFCSKHSLTPLIKSFDLKELWDSSEFYNFAQAVGTVSPQQATYAHAVTQIDKEYPDHIHLFGGEVRYRTDIVQDELNLAYLSKVTPGYNGITYTLNKNISGTIRLLLSSAGTWSITTNGGTLTGAPASGSWTTTPGSSYQYNSTCTYLFDNSTGLANSSPPELESTGWTAITGTVIAAELNMSSIVNQFGSSAANFTIEIRSVGNPASVNGSSITLEAYVNG